MRKSLFLSLLFISSLCHGQAMFSALLTDGDTTQQAYELEIVEITNNTQTLAWQKGHFGTRVIVLAHEAAAVDDDPADGNEYTANAAYGSGDEIGTDNFVVYVGTGISVTVTGLTEDTKYHYKVFGIAGSGGSADYLTWTGTNFVNDKSFTDEFDAVVDFAISQGYAYPQLRHMPNLIGRTDIDYWLSNRREDGTFLTQDIVYLFRLGNASLSNFSTINYRNPAAFQILPVSSPAFGVNGWTGNASSTYLSTQYTPSGGTNFTLNDGGAIIEISAGTENANVNDFSASGAGAAPYFGFQARRLTDQALYGVNNTAAINSTNALTVAAYHQIYRTGASAIGRARNNNPAIDTDTNASTSRPGVPIYLMAGNLNNTMIMPTDRTYGAFEVGASQTGKQQNIYAHWKALIETPNLISVDNIWIDEAREILIATSTDGDAVQTFDISNPNFPRPLGKIVDGGSVTLDGPLGVQAVGNTIFVTCIEDDALVAIDFTNPYRLAQIGAITHGTGGANLNSPWNLTIVADTLAVVCSNTGAEFVDVSDPTMMTHVSRIDDGDDGGNVELSVPLAVRVVDTLAFFAVHNSDAMTIINIVDPSTPTWVSSFTSVAHLDQAHGIHVTDDYYVIVTARGSDKITVVDATTPASPSFYSSLDDGEGGAALNGPVDLDYRDGIVYAVSYDGNNVEIADFTDLSDPTHISKISNGQQGAFLETPDMCLVFGNFLWVTARFGNAIECLNVSNPATPIHFSKIFDGE